MLCGVVFLGCWDYSFYYVLVVFLVGSVCEGGKVFVDVSGWWFGGILFWDLLLLEVDWFLFFCNL